MDKQQKTKEEKSILKKKYWDNIKEKQNENRRKIINCIHCKKEMSKGAMTRHLKICKFIE